MDGQHTQSALTTINALAEPQRTEMLQSVTELIFMKVTEEMENALPDHELRQLESLSKRGATPDELLQALRQVIEAHGLDFERMAYNAAAEADARLTARIQENSSSQHFSDNGR